MFEGKPIKVKYADQLLMICSQCQRGCKKIYSPKMICTFCKGYKRTRKNLFSKMMACVNRAEIFPKKRELYLKQAEELFKKISNEDP